MSGQPNCAAVMAAQSSAAPAVAHTTATMEGEEDDTRPPTLKAAAENPEGPFTLAAAEAGREEEEGEGTVPALKAATDDPEGTFMSVAAEAGPAGVEVEGAARCGHGGGLDIHPLDPESGIGDGEPGLRVLRPKLWKAERGASFVRLLVVHCRGSPM
jgi:hypothetical protein